MSKRPGANCDACPLRANQCISPPENSGARFIAITPAPTTNDIFKGLRSSDSIRLFEKVLNFHSIPYDDFEYIPVVQCDGFKDLSTTEKNRAVKACSGYVLDYVNNAYPEACLSLGPDASLTAVGTRGWTAARPGPARRRGESLAVPVVPTASPQLCMVQQDKFPFLVTDVGKLVNAAPKFVEPDYKIITTEQEALDYLNYLSSQPFGDITIDIETATEKDLAFEHPDRYEMLCVGMQYDDELIHVLAAESLTEDVYVLLASVLRFNNICAHNGKFDLSGLRPKVGKTTLGDDTMLASYIFDERSGTNGLKFLAQEYLGAPNYDAEVSKYVGTSKNFSLVPKEILYKYNAFDVHCTRQLRLMYKQRFSESGEELTRAYEMLIKISNLLKEIEYNGMTVDTEYLEQLVYKFEHDTEVSRKNLVYKALTLSDGVLFDVRQGFNPNSFKQIIEFFGVMGIKINSSNEETLNKIINYDGDGIPDTVKDFAKSILSHRSMIKLGKTYVQGTKDRLHNGRIHPNYLLHGTTTGRLSCRNPNLQNIPRQSPIKRMFVPSGEGRVLIQSDFSQAELRVLSWLSGDRYFTPIFNEGIRDVFDELTPVLYPGAVADAFSKAAWKEMRIMVKTYVYGLGYGRTEYGIARGFGIEVEVARTYMQRFLDAIPEIVEWQHKIRETVKNGQDLITSFGRHRRYNLITNANYDNVMNEALAFLPQSTASDITLKAANASAGQLAYEYDAKIVNLVHDAIMYDCPEENAEAAIQFVEEQMIWAGDSVVDGYVKFAVSSSYGKSWEELV